MNLKVRNGLSKKILGINQRNLDYIYPYNPRKYFPLANDKALTKECLSGEGVPVPSTYYVISTMSEINSLWDRMQRLDEFVIKPAKGRAGGGILVLRKENGGWLGSGGRFYSEKELKKHLADIIFGIYSFGLWDKAIIEYRIHQHQVFDRIFPHGVADIRILVFNHIPRMSMSRIPTYKSGGKANLHQGAIGVSVDLSTGCMGDGYDYRGYFSKHPDTGVEFKGIIIPFWEEILEIGKKTSYAVPLNYIGIDVVIDKDQGPMVIEINARPGLEIQNVNRRGLGEVLFT